MKIKNKLLDLRLERRFKTQKEFANFLSIGTSYYSKLESNRSLMTLETLFDIAHKLNIDINDIVYSEEDS